MFVTITAKVDGFRRIGMAHYGTKRHPPGTFTKEQIEVLLKEPNLKVVLTKAAIENPILEVTAEETRAEEPLREAEPLEVPEPPKPSITAPEDAPSGAEAKKSKAKK
jgi:hypothetical protein